jgi:hypothetical protein
MNALEQGRNGEADGRGLAPEDSRKGGSMRIFSDAPEDGRKGGRMTEACGSSLKMLNHEACCMNVAPPPVKARSALSPI